MDQYFKEIENLIDSDNLVEANLKWAAKVAHKYKGNGLPLEDLIQQANLGLIIAAEKYDPSKGTKFLTYAQSWILNKIKSALNSNSSIVSRPESFQIQSGKVRKAINKLKNNGDEPTLSKISQLTGFSERSVENTMSNAITGVVSINQTIGDSNREIETVIGDEDVEEPLADFNTRERDDSIEKLMKVLPEKERIAVVNRFINNKTLQEVGNIFGMTPAGASVIVKRGLKKLKARANELNLTYDFIGA